MIKTVATIVSVERRATRTGKDMIIVRDDQGRDYSTFVPDLMRKAEEMQGQQVALGYDEQQKGQYTNRYLRYLGAAETSGADSVRDNGQGGNASWSEDSTYAGGPRDQSVSGVLSGQGDGYNSSSAAVAGDWLAIIREAARRGEWRAAEALQRREDIARSVALNNTITFFQYLAEDNRKPENVKVIFDYILKALNEN